MCDHPDLREVPLSEKEMFHGVLIDVSHMQVRLPNGHTALREVVRHKGAAAVVPVDGEGNVYLVRQHRVVVDLMTLEIPAGKLDYVGEDPLACAHRELEEETGLSGVRLKQFEAFSEVNRDPRGRTISVAFVGEVEKEKCVPKAADDAKEVAWFALEKLPELAFDHRTIIARAMSWYLMAEMLMLMSEEESRQSEDTKNGK